MDYDDILAQVVARLQREKRLSYRVLKRRLHLETRCWKISKRP